jgi:SPP1 family predicted phage head-tail adaptor
MLSQQLNKVITIEKGTISKNSIGTPEYSWNTYITTYAKVLVLSNDTRFTSQGQLFSYRTEFSIRYNSDTKVINNKYRVKYNDDYYKIIAIQEIGIKEGFKLITVGFEDNGFPEI